MQAQLSFSQGKFFSQDALAFGCEIDIGEQKRANHYQVIRADRCADALKSCRVKRSEPECGDIAQRDERCDARDHIDSESR